MELMDSIAEVVLRHPGMLVIATNRTSLSSESIPYLVAHVYASQADAQNQVVLATYIVYVERR